MVNRVLKYSFLQSVNKLKHPSFEARKGPREARKREKFAFYLGHPDDRLDVGQMGTKVMQSRSQKNKFFSPAKSYRAAVDFFCIDDLWLTTLYGRPVDRTPVILMRSKFKSNCCEKWDNFKSAGWPERMNMEKKSLANARRKEGLGHWDYFFHSRLLLYSRLLGP